MASVHLTNDNGAVIRADDDPPGANHLAGVNKTASHLVVVKQLSAWSDKEFVLTPKEKKFVWADAWGKEAYPSIQAGSSVKEDTDALINLTNARIASAAWQTGNKAIFSCFTRACDIRCLYDEVSSWQAYSGFATSAVALKFDFRHLHASLLTDYKAYVRAYMPSILTCEPYMDTTNATLISGGFHSGASRLRVRFADEPGETAAGVIDGTALSFELAGHANNRRVVDRDTDITTWGTYDPLDQFAHDSTLCRSLPTRVYMTDKDNPTSYHHDFQITGSQLDELKKNPGEKWLLARFHPGNAFSSGVAAEGLKQSHAATVYVQRLEIVLKCTGGKVNA